MKARFGVRPSAGLLAIAAVAAVAVTFVQAANATNAPGALNCPTLKPFNPNKYGLQSTPTQQTVTCTIDGASDASGKTTVPVIIKSSDTGNVTVTGTVSGSGASTKITFTFTAPTVGCNTVVVAYISNGNNTNSSLIGGGGAAGGFAYIDGSGNLDTVCGGAPPPPPPTPAIYLGYADTYFTHGSPNGFPWNGQSPAPLVIGCGVNPNGGGSAADACDTFPDLPGVDSYDAGAIRIDNTSTTQSMPIGAASVTIGTCTYNPWPGLNITLPPGGSLVLTQTGGANPCPAGGEINGNYNFDTSEAHFGPATCGVSDGLIPAISLTINGSVMTVNDTGEILNTGGYDPGICYLPGFNVNEFHPWVQVF